MKKFLILFSLSITSNFYATPLHEAVKNNSLEEVKHLVYEGADINAVDDFGKTPLFYAKDNENLYKFLILNGANIDLILPKDAILRITLPEYVRDINYFVTDKFKLKKIRLELPFQYKKYETLPFIFVFSMKNIINKILKNEKWEPKQTLIYCFFSMAKKSTEREKNEVKSLIKKDLGINLDFDAYDLKTFLSKALEAAKKSKNRMLIGSKKALEKLDKIKFFSEKMKKYPKTKESEREFIEIRTQH